MTHLAGCALFPHPPIMLKEVGGAESLHVRETVTAAEAAARFLQERNPSTVVVMTPHGPAFRDAVGVNVSPVLKGNLAAFGAAEVSVSFETNSLLVQNILKQSRRLGVSMLPLDTEQGTAFQRKVWKALRGIPPGQTRTYTEVAHAIGQPKAVRAVASACAANPLAVLVPCHRVLRSDGGWGGYRWGLARKQQLLQLEGAMARLIA